MSASAVALLVGGLVAPQDPAVPAEFPYRFVPVDAIHGHLMEGRFKEPGGVYFDAVARELYVTDMKNGLVGIFDEGGIPVFAFGGRALLVDPEMIHAARDGAIHVLDADQSRVKVFDYRGTPLDPIVFPAPEGGPPIERIGTFTVDAEGSWYVADADRPRVLVYDRDLRFRHAVPRDDDVGSFELVTGLAVSAEGVLVVLDYRATPVQMFDPEGRFLVGFGERDIGLSNFTAPVAAAFDGDGYLYVVDLLRHDVKVFDQRGGFRARFGGWSNPATRGRGPGELLYPNSIAITPDGAIFVSERYGNRVQLFGRVRREESRAGDG